MSGAAYDALRTRLDLYRSVLETYTYEVESFYTSVKKAISEPVPQVFVLKKGRDLFFRSEKTPLFLCVKEISPGSSIQQQLPEQTSPETNNPAPLGNSNCSVLEIYDVILHDLVQDQLLRAQWEMP